MQPEEISPELLEKYCETVVEILLDGKTICDQELHNIWKADFYMITAANPYSQLLPESENEIRNQQLLEHLLLQVAEVLPAIGRDPLGSWVEKGWVLQARHENQLIDIAKQFEQNAIFKFTGHGKEVIDCL
jgi:hypothetical protein